MGICNTLDSDAQLFSRLRSAKHVIIKWPLNADGTYADFENPITIK